MPVLRVDAQFTVIEAALKGYMKWRANTTQQSLPDYVSNHLLGLWLKLLKGDRNNNVPLWKGTWSRGAISSWR